MIIYLLQILIFACAYIVVKYNISIMLYMLTNAKKGCITVMNFKKAVMCFGMCIMMSLVSMGAAFDTAGKEVTVTYVDKFNDTATAASYKTKQKTIEAFFDEVGISKGKFDKISHNEQCAVVDGADITITKGVPVTIFYNDHIATAITTKPTVSEALLEAGLMPGENDLVTPSADTNVYEHMVIRVTCVTEEEKAETEYINFETKYIEDDTLEKGKTKVISEGEKGLAEVRYTVVYHDSKTASKTEVSRTVIKEPENRIIANGTKEPVKETVKSSPTPAPKKTEQKTVQKKADTSNASASAEAGTVSEQSSAAAVQTINGLKYTKKLEMTATAYSAFNSSGGYARTASGALAKKGIVAVDKSVIPLGTRLYIEGYGEAVAGDVGGAIKGNKIDLCFEDTNANLKKFGRQKVQVYILE